LPVDGPSAGRLLCPHECLWGAVVVGYRAAIDFGTSYTVAACQAGSQAASVLNLVSEGRLTSAVALDNEGRLQAGPYVDEALALAPDRVERTPKRCVDQPDVMLGGQPVQTVDLVAAVLRYVRDEMLRHFNGRDPDELWLTHPARWETGDPRMERLEAAARQAGFGQARLLAEPCAAALALAAAGQLDVTEGELIAVYDLGGGTFDTALLSRAPGGDFVLVGEPGGDQELGGEWLDDRLFERLSGQLPADDEASLRDPGSSPDASRWRRAGAAFRQEIRKAKERLARETSVQIPLSPPFSLDHLSLSRADLERTATSLINESADRFELFLQRNGHTAADLAAICLVGGSSRLTVVNRILGNRFGPRHIATLGDPKAVTALGALAGEPGPAVAPFAETPPGPAAPMAPAPPVQAPVVAAPVVAAPVVTAPAARATVPPAPVQPAPVQPAPVQPAPVQPAPVLPTPVLSTPVMPAAVPLAPVPPATLAMPIAATGYPVLPGDMQWSGPLTGDSVVERIAVGPGAWVKIGDLLMVLRGMNSVVTIWSTYIGRIESLACQVGQPLVLNQPMLTLAVSGWLMRPNCRMPFDTGLLLTSGSPSHKLDPAGTVARLAVTVDNAGRRLVPWRARCLLHVPAGSHVFSAIYEQPGTRFTPVSKLIKIHRGKRIALTYEAPYAYGKNGKLRS
jgi:molecular chaperone DnaK